MSSTEGIVQRCRLQFMHTDTVQQCEVGFAGKKTEGPQRNSSYKTFQYLNIL